MDFLKKTASRAQQTVSESLGSAQKSEFNSDTVALMARADEIRLNTTQLIHALENYIQPDPTQKVMDALTGDAPSKAQQLGASLKNFGDKLESWQHATAPAFQEGAKAYSAIGQSEKSMYASMSTTLAPLKAVLRNEVAVLDEERRRLTNIRLDMDTLKNKKAVEAEKIAEAEKGFADQQARVCELVRSLETKVSDYRQNLKALVVVDLAHYKQCVTALEALEKTL